MSDMHLGTLDMIVLKSGLLVPRGFLHNMQSFGAFYMTCMQSFGAFDMAVLYMGLYT